MTIIQKIKEEQIKALKLKSKTTGAEQEQAVIRLSVLRAALAAVSEAETSGKTRKELSEQETINLLKKESDKRISSSKIYAEAGAPERAETEALEAEILKEFLPNETSEKEIADFIETFVAENGLSGQGGKAIGVVMTALKNNFTNFNAKKASEVIKEKVS